MPPPHWQFQLVPSTSPHSRDNCEGAAQALNAVARQYGDGFFCWSYDSVVYELVAKVYSGTDNYCSDLIRRLDGVLWTAPPTMAPTKAPPPPPRYVCLDDHCRPSNMTTAGLSKDVCAAVCGTAALKYKCTKDGRCAPSDGGIAYEACEAGCAK